MTNTIEIFKSEDNSIELKVALDMDTVWLSQEQMAVLFEKGRSTITEHIRNVFKEGELTQKVVCREFRHTTQHGAIAGKTQEKSTKFYNLDVIISVGYRVKSKRGTQFRQWATQRLKDYLVQGYAINEKRLAQKQQEVEYLKTGIRILNRAIEEQTTAEEYEMLRVFAKGLELLDDYDHETLDKQGLTKQETVFPTFDDYMNLIRTMYSEFESGVFAKPKDDSFHSSINQIKQGFGTTEFYPTIEEKAANLLYFITKNHSFVDGNKRIAAACFLYFLQQNNVLLNSDGSAVISNSTLAALTLFIANSKTEESEIVKKLAISILNRNKI
jgi:prophage maintenance system killer protein